MRNHDTRPWALLLLGGALAGCAGGEEAAFDPSPDDGISACTLDADCPSGLVCRASECVNPEDLLPPDLEQPQIVGRPAATATRLLTLSAATDALLLIEPERLELEAVPVPRGPTALAVIPDEEAALVLSEATRSLTFLDLEAGPSAEVLRLARRYVAVDVSPDGAWAVLWTPDGVEPDEGAEGLVAVVDLDALAAGEGAAVELAAGFRHTDVHFVAQGGATTELVVLGKGAATFVTLGRLDEAGYRPERMRLPEAFAEVIGREVVARPGAQVLLLRSLASAGIGLLDVGQRRLTELALPGRATDLDLSPDGARALAALRGVGQLALLPLPDVLSSSAALELIDVDGVTPGQVELSADGTHAAVFSGQDGSERFGWIELSSGALTVFDGIEKEVRSIGLSPDGRTALVVHQANPTSSVADDYERAVDRDEGYSLVDLESGFAQLKRTGSVAPLEITFTASGRRAAITLRDDAEQRHRVEAADLDRLVVTPYELASSPRFLGALPGSERVWVTQDHPAGRISVLDLAAGRLRTLTGFELDAEITEGPR